MVVTLLYEPVVILSSTPRKICSCLRQDAALWTLFPEKATEDWHEIKVLYPAAAKTTERHQPADEVVRGVIEAHKRMIPSPLQFSTSRTAIALLPPPPRRSTISRSNRDSQENDSVAAPILNVPHRHQVSSPRVCDDWKNTIRWSPEEGPYTLYIRANAVHKLKPNQKRITADPDFQMIKKKNSLDIKN